MLRTRRALVIVLCGLAMAGCGGGGAQSQVPAGTSRAGTAAPVSSTMPATAAPPVAAAVDACSLLSDEEISRTLGYPVKTKTAGPVQGIFTNGCSWEVDSADERFVDWSIDLGVITPGGRRYYDTYLAIVEGEPLSGLGDVAIQDDVGAVNAVKGDTLVSVFLIASGSDKEDEMTRQLTQTALSHL